MTSDEILKTIVEADKKRTPGPWEYDAEELQVFATPSQELISQSYISVDGIENVEFIALAGTHMGELARELTEARLKISRMHEEIRKLLGDA